MTHFLVPYMLLTLGLIGSLILFLSVKREMHFTAARHRRQLEELSIKLSESPPSQPEPAFIPVSPRPGFNVNKRVHAMRMLRRNEDVSHIAAALGVTRREIELLIRVQKLSAATVSSAAS